MAWALASVCLLGHLPHWWRGIPHALHRLASPHLHAVLSAIALIGSSFLIDVEKNYPLTSVSSSWLLHCHLCSGPGMHVFLSRSSHIRVARGVHCGTHQWGV